jgi:hypothetical protein
VASGSWLREAARVIVTTVFTKGVLVSCVSAMTQTPAWSGAVEYGLR